MNKTTTAPPFYTAPETPHPPPPRPALPRLPPRSRAPTTQARRARVLDGVDFDWPLEVDAGDAGKLGRLEALRQAFDRLVRERLG